MEGRRTAPLCRVGRSNEPAKAGGAAVVGRASGFLETEACTTRDLAARLGCCVGSDEPPKPSRAKQERHDLTVRPEEGQDARTLGRAAGSNRSFRSDLREGFVNDALEADCTFVQIVGRYRQLVALTEELVGDVEGNQDGETEHVARRGRVRGR